MTAGNGKPSDLFDAHAEAAVVAALQYDDDGTTYDQILEFVGAEDFYSSQNAEILRAITDLRESGQKPDPLTVRDRLGRTGRLGAAGGEEHLSWIVDVFPCSDNGPAHARIVRDLANRRRIAALGQRMIADATEPGKRPIEEILDFHQSAMFKLAAAPEGSGPVHVQEIATRVLAELDDPGPPPIATGLHDLDRLLQGGLRRQELVIAAARPSVGKSALAFQVGLSAAFDRDKSVAIFSLEMAKREAQCRLFALRTGVPLAVLFDRQRQPTPEQRARLQKAGEEFGRVRLFMDDASSLTVTALRARARRLKARHGLDLVIVDYLQLMTAPRAESRVQEVGQIVRGLKVMAKDVGVAVLAAAQLNRGPEYRGTEERRPRLSDLKDSGEIEQSADTVLMLYRPDYYDPAAARAAGKSNTGEIIVGKARNGPTGMVEVGWNGSLARFDSLSRRF